MPVYSDINQTTPTESPLVEDIDSVYQALEVLFTTSPGDRLFNPEFGTLFEEFLFELMDEETELDIYRLVIQAVERFEPRVRLNYGETKIESYPEENKYIITLAFTLRGYGDKVFEYVQELEG